MSFLDRLEALERRLAAIEKLPGNPPKQPAPEGPQDPPVASAPSSDPLAHSAPDVAPTPPAADQIDPFVSSDDHSEDFCIPPEHLFAASDTPTETEDEEWAPEAEPFKVSWEKRQTVREFFKHQAQRQSPPSRAPASWGRALFALEEAIGLRWSGRIGAVVLVIGAAMGVQFAYQNRWLTHLAPDLWLTTIFAAGVALLIAGEVVRRRVHQVPATSLFGAGIAVLFLGSYAGYGCFDLYSRSISLALMGGSMLIGAGVARGRNLVSIALLSLICATGAPILLVPPGAAILPFLLYLLMTLVVAVTLAAWGHGGKWWLLRGLSLCSVVVWIGFVLDGPQARQSAAFGFMILGAALYHAELILTSIRRAPQLGDTLSAPGDAAIGRTFAVCVTAALCLGLLKYFGSAGDACRAGSAIVLSLISGALGLILPKIHPALRKLAFSHRLAAVGLLVVAALLGAGGAPLEIGWMLMALGFALSWRLIDSRLYRLAAPITWLLGLSYLCFQIISALEAHRGWPWGQTWLLVDGTAIGANVILAWLFALSGQLIAVLIVADERLPWGTKGEEVGALCGALWIVVSIASLPGLGATCAILGYAWLLWQFDRIVPSFSLAREAVTCLLLATVKWAAVDTLAARLSPAWTATTPVLNPLTGVGALLAASLAGSHLLSRHARRRQSPGKLPDENGEAPVWNLVTTSAVIALMTISFSFEIDRIVTRATIPSWSYPLPAAQVLQLSFTILWSFSIGVLAAAVAWLAPTPLAGAWRRAIWVLILLLSAKFIFVDSLAPFTDATGPLTPVLNLQVFAGVSIIACLAAMRWIAPQSSFDTPNARWAAGLLAALLIAWIGTLEIDRAIARHPPSSEAYAVSGHLKQLAWTVWWMLVAAVMLLVCRHLDRSPQSTTLWLRELPVAIGLITAKHLVVDIAFWWQTHPPPVGWNVLLNWDVLTTAIVLAGAWLPQLLRLPSGTVKPGMRQYFHMLASGTTVILLLATGLIEVDRAFTLPRVRQAVSDAALAEQLALSIYLAVFAILTLSAGFRRHSAQLRRAGLAILVITLLKVVVVDMSQVRHGYRILSFLGLGVILLLTSVMYGKITPRLLQQHE